MIALEFGSSTFTLNGTAQICSTPDQKQYGCKYLELVINYKKRVLQSRTFANRFTFNKLHFTNISLRILAKNKSLVAYNTGETYVYFYTSSLTQVNVYFQFTCSSTITQVTSFITAKIKTANQKCIVTHNGSFQTHRFSKLNSINEPLTNDAYLLLILYYKFMNSVAHLQLKINFYL